MQPPVYDPTAALAPGINVIEASAGTGKTYQISNLVLRLITEHEIPIDRIMVVTFTNAATAELRNRIRARLEQAHEALANPEPGGAARAADPVLHMLESAEGAERLAFTQRLSDACADFDTASISTIHGFCETVLREHAFDAHADPTAKLITDTGLLTAEIVDDWLSRRRYAATPSELAFLDHKSGAAIRPARLRKIAGRVASNDEPIVCGGQPAADFASAIQRAAQWWRGAGREAFIDAVDDAARRDCFSAPGTWKRTKKDGQPHPTLEKWMASLDAWAEQATDEHVDHVYRLCGVALIEKFNEKWQGSDADRDLGLPEWESLCQARTDVAAFETRQFVEFARAEFRARLARRNERSFDDLLGQVARAVERRPEGALVEALRGRHDAVLIDEFQDTDHQQWTIFNRVFGQARTEGGAPRYWLYLIGDPKQAIYSFRGADVHVYLEARELAVEDGSEATLDVNYRSDGPLVHALNALFRDEEAVFAQPPELRYRTVRAHHDSADRFSGHASGAALTIRVVDASAGYSKGAGPIRRKGPAEQLTAKIVADDIRKQLDASPRIQLDGDELQPGHFAVLVRTNRQAEEIESRLRACGVPCVRGANGNVFESAEASHLRDFLAAVDQPQDAARARALARTPLGGWTGANLSEAFEGRGQERAWTRWLEQIDLWNQQLQSVRLARTVSPILRETGFIERITRFDDAERRLTNYRHLIELLHAAETEQRLGPTALRNWLRDQSEADERTHEGAELRLESDAHAVQIATIHGSKGLQYPCVYVPYLWCSSPEDNHYLMYPTEAGRVIDVRPQFESDAKDKAALERRREDLRLLYVAMTRAQHSVTAYWTAHFGRGDRPLLKAPLTEVLFGGNDEGEDRRAFARERVREALQSEDAPFDALHEPLMALVEAGRAPERGGATIACELAAPPQGGRWQSDEAPLALAPARVFPRRGLEQHWRRLSYSSLTAHRHGGGMRPEDLHLVSPAELARDGRDFDDGEGSAREPLRTVAPRDETSRSAEEVLLAPFPGGPEPGSFVHKVLETIDFETRCEKAGPQRDLATLLDELGPRYGINRADHRALLATALPGILSQSLGDAAGGIALRDLTTADRLDELEFDLALRGGDQYDERRNDPVWWPGWRKLLCAPRPAGSHVPDAYLEQLRDPEFQLTPLAGFLTGSIDLVYRVGHEDGGRWFVCDYKTNKLRNLQADENGRRPVTQSHYTLPWLQHEMARHHYFIQYHLYTLVLHRFLRQRLADYDYDRNIGGAAYLFVRGMNEDGPGGQGVFFDRPPRELIEGMDELFSGPRGVA